MRTLGIAMAVSLLGAALTPVRATAQSELDAAEAQDFLGHWLVNFESAQGALVVELELTDEGGKVAANVTVLQLGTQEVTNVTRSEGTLTLQWEADAQGQLLPLLVELTRDGENLAVVLDIGMGQMTADGIGTRVKS